MQLNLPQQGEKDWYKKFTKAFTDLSGQIVLDKSNRNYTLTNGATKSTGNDSLYVYRERSLYMDRIYGIGNVHIPAMNGGNNFGIILPYDVSAGDFITGDGFTYSFRPYYAIDPNGGQVLVYTDVATKSQDIWLKFEIAHYKG